MDEMAMNRRISRGTFLQIGTGAAVAGIAGPNALANVPAASPLDRAYAFLDAMMDRYTAGRTLRLVQSYVPTGALNLNNIAFTYDNALVLLAYLQRGKSADITRATTLGDSLLFAQQHDDRLIAGRIRNAYYAHPYVVKGHSNGIGIGTFTGNLAWTGIALAALARRTHAKRFLDGAVAAASWLELNTGDLRGAGGYTGGVAPDGSIIQWKATEHNVDVFALFTLVHALTGDTKWLQRAQHARGFIHAMWNKNAHHFWTGTGNDGKTVNTAFIPEDAQTWTYLALREQTYASSLDWAANHLSAVDGRFRGVSFSTADRSGVWFEGTGHLAAALRIRNGNGDAAAAASYLQSIELAQTRAPNADGKGIVAASHDGLATGDGGSYYAALHTGATAWYCLAKLKGNPFR